MGTRLYWAIYLTVALPVWMGAQTAPAPKQENKFEDKDRDDGIPVTSEAVRKACGACHPSDERQRMSRISYRRTTPEGWEQTIKRMVALNGVHLQPDQAREVLRDLANQHGLAPEEAKPALFEAERRLIDYKYTDNDTEQTCIKCHSFGRVLQQRRTKTDWELLIAMHRGYYPLVDFQAFRRMGPARTEPGPDGRPPDNRHPMEKAVAHLSGAFPLKTAEWSAWSANMRAPKLEGRWALSGYQAGLGPVYGEVTIEPAPGSADEFRTRARFVYPRSGRTVTRDGKSIVYTGHQWRGRSGDGDGAMREVMLIDRGMREMTGRWFNGAYNETGMDVTLTRIGRDPVVLGLADRGLRAGQRTEVRIFGANLPTPLQPAAIDLGRGVTVVRVVRSAADSAAVEVDVAADAAAGARDVFVAGVAAPGAAAVYDRIDTIKVRPQSGMARNGGVRFPKQYQQFEAFAFHNGPDGKPDTKDDFEIGPVKVAWSMEEFAATFDDDDIKYVGTLDDNGLFTPNVDGPNPARRNSTNNYGDVWVVATYTPPQGAKESKPMRARAHLLVTVPLYMRFDQPGVAP